MFRPPDSAGQCCSWLDGFKTIIRSRQQHGFPLRICLSECYFASRDELQDLLKEITMEDPHIWSGIDEHEETDAEDEAA